MATCRYCGAKAGWFADVHSECAASARKGAELIASEVATAVRAGKTFLDIKPAIEQIKTRHHMPEAELREAIIGGWNPVVREISQKEPMGTERFDVLNTFSAAAGANDDNIPDWCKKYDGFYSLSLSNVLWHILNDDPYPYTGRMTFNLQRGEVALFGIGNVLYLTEQTHSAYAGGYGGASIRVGRGLYYHLGGIQGQRASRVSMDVIDEGDWFFTTKNMYYGGQHASFRLPYSSIIRLTPYVDGLGVFTNGGKPQVYITKLGDYGWFVYNIVRHLSDNNAKAGS